MIVIDEGMPPNLRLLFEPITKQMEIQHQMSDATREFRSQQDKIVRKRVESAMRYRQKIDQAEQDENQQVKREKENHKMDNQKLRVINEMLKRSKLRRQQ